MSQTKKAARRFAALGLRDFMRAAKPADDVLVHELGHTYGNRYCEDQNCVMLPVSYVESLDALPVNYCRECLHRVLTASRPDIWPVIWSGVPKNWSQHPKYGY